jgi:hypothetical protein
MLEWSLMKLSAKFARHETEAARLARISRRRISEVRRDAVRRMLGLPEEHRVDIQAADAPGPTSNDDARVG